MSCLLKICTLTVWKAPLLRICRTHRAVWWLILRQRPGELFHDISEMNPAEIEETVKFHVQAKIDEYGIDAQIVDVAVVGSRCRGLEREGSDLDVVVELSTNEREDDLFNTFNEDGLHIGGVKVDINPITEQRTGSA